MQDVLYTFEGYRGKINPLSIAEISWRRGRRYYTDWISTREPKILKPVNNFLSRNYPGLAKFLYGENCLKYRRNKQYGWYPPVVRIKYTGAQYFQEYEFSSNNKAEKSYTELTDLMRYCINSSFHVSDVI